MAWKAIYNSKVRHARKIPLGETAYCTECDGEMAVWKNRAGTATHLKHTSNMGSSNSGQGTDCAGGEGDDHNRWKGLAADAVEDAFDDIDDVDGFSKETKTELVTEKGVSAPVSDKQRRIGDVVLTFTERDWQLGDGLIIEVQDANKSKNRTLTTQDYVEQGFAVVWLYEDDFIETRSDESPGKCRLNEADFRHRARQAVKEYAFEEQTQPWFEWTLSDDPYYHYSEQTVKPLTVATESLSPEHHVPATFTPECVDSIIYERLDWSSIEPLTDSATRHRLRAMIDNGTTTRVDATLKRAFALPSEPESWNLTLLPDPDPPATDRFFDELRSEHEQVPVNISVSQWLSGDFWRIAYFRGMAQRSGLLSRGHEEKPQRPPKPANPFDDIQCQNCGHYKPVSDASQVCDNCSTLYDLSWNVETRRVSSESVKKHILPTPTSDQ